MPEFETIIYERVGQVAHITLNRPEKLNAMNSQMHEDLHAGLELAEKDDDVKCIVIKGAGRAFSAGFDLTRVYVAYSEKAGETPGARRPSQRSRLHADHNSSRGFEKLLYCWKPTITQVHGYCIGGSFGLMLLTDLTVVAEDAILGHVDQRMGFAGASRVLIPELYLIGQKRMRELMLTGRMLSGKEAAEWGLVNRAVPVDQLDAEVAKLTESICLLPRDGIAIGKSQTQLAYQRLGFTEGLMQGYWGHTLFTNIRWEPDEYNFLKKRNEGGTKEAFHERDRRYDRLAESDAGQE